MSIKCNAGSISTERNMSTPVTLRGDHFANILTSISNSLASAHREAQKTVADQHKVVLQDILNTLEGTDCGHLERTPASVSTSKSKSKDHLRFRNTEESLPWRSSQDSIQVRNDKRVSSPSGQPPQDFSNILPSPRTLPPSMNLNQSAESQLPGMLSGQQSGIGPGRDSELRSTPVLGLKKDESFPSLGSQMGSMLPHAFSTLSSNVGSVKTEDILSGAHSFHKATTLNLDPQIENFSRSLDASAWSGEFTQQTSDMSERSGHQAVELLPVWRNRVKTKVLVTGAYRSQTRFLRSQNSFTVRSEKDEESCILRCWRRLIISPGATKRFVWDLVSLMLVIYDMGSIPLSLLEPPENVFTDVMQWITRIFWSFDIPASFLTGYMAADASHIMHPYKIARNYLRSWFPLDALLVSMDWLELIWGSLVEDASKYGRVGKAGRVFRILRMIRLLRLVRMRSIIHIITTRVQSEKIVIFIDIVKIMLAMVSLSHVIACIWYGIGNSSGEDNWIHKYDVRRYELIHRYMMAMHWSLAQFQGGMDEFVPQNFRERFFAVCVFVFAWLTAAFFVSLLTSSMTRLHILSSHQSRQLNVLQKFLKQNMISDRLALRVHRNATHGLTEKQRLMPEQEVELLNMVSDPLRVEIHFEMYAPVLEVHPFFAHYVIECPQVMRKVCHFAMSMLLVSTGDVVFNAGEAPANPKFYIACSGIFEYLPFYGEKQEVLEEDWLSEAALWSRWVHHGTLKSLCDGRLAVLDAKCFQDIVGQFEHSLYDPKSYATTYVEHLLEMLRNGEKLSDMPFVGQYEHTIAKGMFDSVAMISRSGSRASGNTHTLSITSSFASANRRRKRSVFIGNGSNQKQQATILQQMRAEKTRSMTSDSLM